MTNATHAIYLQQILTRIRSRRRFLAAFVACCCLIALVLVLVPERRYAVEVTTFPVDSSMNAGVGLGAQFASGLLARGKEYQDFYPRIAVSRSVMERVVAEPFPTSHRGGEAIDAIHFFKLEDLPAEQAEQKLYEVLAKEIVSARVEMLTGALTLRVVTTDPMVSATIANRTAYHLDEYVRKLRSETTRLQGKFVELRMAQVLPALQEAEAELTTFLQKNRRVEDSPDLMLKRAQLQRAVTMHEAVFVELKRAEEMNRLEEMRDLPRVHLLDPALPPLRPSYPARARSMVLAFAVSVVMGVVVILLEPTFRAAWSAGRDTPSGPDS